MQKPEPKSNPKAFRLDILVSKHIGGKSEWVGVPRHSGRAPRPESGNNYEQILSLDNFNVGGDAPPALGFEVKLSLQTPLRLSC